MSEKSKFELDLHGLFEDVDSLICVILRDETKQQPLVNNAAKNLMLQIGRFRNEYNYTKEKEGCLDSSFSDDDNNGCDNDLVDRLVNQGTAYNYVPSSSSSGDSSSTSSSLPNSVDTTQTLVDEQYLKMDAQSVTLKAEKWEHLLQIKTKSSPMDSLLNNLINKNKHIWSLNRVPCGGKLVYLFYIFKDLTDKKPMSAFYAKDIQLTIEGEKLLRLKVSNLELNYEAMTNIHAQNWLVLFATKAKTMVETKQPMAYERQPFLTQVVQVGNKANTLPPSPPDRPAPTPPVEEPIRNDRPLSDVHADLTKPQVPFTAKYELNQKMLKEIQKKQQEQNNRKNSLFSDATSLDSSVRSFEEKESDAPPLPISLIPPRPLQESYANQKIEEPYDAIEASRTSVQNIDREDYMNSNFLQSTYDADCLYLCQYPQNAMPDQQMLNAKCGDVIQLIEKLSDVLFIGKYMDQPSSLGICDYSNFVKIYHNKK